MMKFTLTYWKAGHLLLAFYMIALISLLMLPIVGVQSRLFGIEFDKWMHVALFGGLAMLLRLNLFAHRRVVLVSVGSTFVLAAVTEVAQGLVTYRSAEYWDLVAGSIGALLGAFGADQILSSTLLRRMLGLAVAGLGSIFGAFFLVADVIGVGDGSQFGILQIAGMTLGALIAIWGVRVHLTGLRGVVFVG